MDLRPLLDVYVKRLNLKLLIINKNHGTLYEEVCNDIAIKLHHFHSEDTNELQKNCPRWVTGVKNRLADSSAYPKQFGEAVFMAYKCWNVSCHSKLKTLTSNYNTLQ